MPRVAVALRITSIVQVAILACQNTAHVTTAGASRVVSRGIIGTAETISAAP
jgi:hypothetical protein